MTEEILKSWIINNKVNIMLLDAIGDSGLNARPVAKRQGRSVGEQFAHLHNVRFGWLEVCAKDYLGKTKKLDKESATTVKILKKALEESGKSIENLLRDLFDCKTKLKSYKGGAGAYLGYMLAHDAHHRGQILIALKQSGIPIDQKIQFGIWEWDKI